MTPCTPPDADLESRELNYGYFSKANVQTFELIFMLPNGESETHEMIQHVKEVYLLAGKFTPEELDLWARTPGPKSIAADILNVVVRPQPADERGRSAFNLVPEGVMHINIRDHFTLYIALDLCDDDSSVYNRDRGLDMLQGWLAARRGRRAEA